ncbi:MAG: hypothetical protein MHM6MM_000134 [Cercozoa sp. M6MM]
MDMYVKRTTFTDNVLAQVVDPMYKFHEEGEKRRKTIASDFKKHSDKIATSVSQLEKLRASASKTWEALKEAKRNFQEKQASGDPKVASAEKALQSKQSSCAKEFEKLEEQCREVNALQREAFDSAFPLMARELEQLELDRLEMQREMLALFVTFLGECHAPLPDMTQRLSDMTQALEPERNLSECADTLVSRFGMPQLPPTQLAGLPCNIGDVRNGSFDSNASFGRSEEASAAAVTSLTPPSPPSSVPTPPMSSIPTPAQSAIPPRSSIPTSTIPAGVGAPAVPVPTARRAKHSLDMTATSEAEELSSVSKVSGSMPPVPPRGMPRPPNAPPRAPVPPRSTPPGPRAPIPPRRTPPAPAGAGGPIPPRAPPTRPPVPSRTAVPPPRAPPRTPAPPSGPRPPQRPAPPSRGMPLPPRRPGGPPPPRRPGPPVPIRAGGTPPPPRR